MTRSYLVQSTAVENVPVVVSTVADPTAAVPGFAFTVGDTDPSAFTDGSWSGSFDAARSRAVALTPLLPATGSTVPLAAGRWTVWVRYTQGVETVVDRVGVLVVA